MRSISESPNIHNTLSEPIQEINTLHLRQDASEGDILARCYSLLIGLGDSTRKFIHDERIGPIIPDQEAQHDEPR